MELLIGALLLLVALYFSVLSFSLRTYSRARLAAHWDERQQQVWLPRLDRFESQFQYLSGVMRIAATLLIIAYVYYQYLPIESGERTPGAFAVPTLIALAVLLIVGLGLPHALALHAGEAILSVSLPLLWVLRYPFAPLLVTLQGLEWLVRRLLGKTGRETEDAARGEQDLLEAVTEGEMKGAVDEEQKEMIESVIEFHETTAGEIMTPRTDIFAMPATATYEEARARIVDAGHSRIPVYDGTLDHIVGVLYAKDMLKFNPGDPFDLRKLMRTAPYVPATKPLDGLLNEFRAVKVQIAIVLDEYGGTAGLVTLEDILEELVGEIDDEYDQAAPPPIRRVDEHAVEVDARVHVYDLNKELELELPEDGTYETIGGFLFSAMGRVPARGDQFTHANIRFTVLDAEPRRVNRVRLDLLHETQDVQS